jgi:nicotinamide riboside kinase
MKIGVIGSFSSGKSTAAAKAYAILKEQHIDVALVTEFTRDIFGTGWNCESISDEFFIYYEQKRREDYSAELYDVMITDSPVLLPYVYGLMFSTRSHHDNIVIKKLYETFVDNLNRYDCLIFIERDHPYVNDGIRKGSEECAEEIAMRIKSMLHQHNVSYLTIKSTDNVAQQIASLVISRMNPKLLEAA